LHDREIGRRFGTGDWDWGSSFLHRTGPIVWCPLRESAEGARTAQIGCGLAHKMMIGRIGMDYSKGNQGFEGGIEW